MVNLIKECRLCKSQLLDEIIAFGDCALANSYPLSLDVNEEKYPLSVVRCLDCGHVQLRETVNPSHLFKNYLYSSSDSPSLLTHFKEYADCVDEVIKDVVHKNILEVGCNDGILLTAFEQLGCTKLIGVDPAENIIKRAKEKTNATLYNNFFNSDIAKQIVKECGSVNIVCANNVLAHVAELDSIMNGIVNCLDAQGVLVFENAYLLNTIQGLYFDQIYHEHLQYYGIKPLVRYLDKYGLEIFHIKLVSTQGGSFRIFAQKKQTGKFSITPTVNQTILAEENFELYNKTTYENFVSKLKDLQMQMHNFLDNAAAQNKTICCYGCPAKFALFSKFFNLNNTNIKYVVDDSPLKQERYSPGSNIKIVSRDYFINNPTDYCIVSVWNMADSIMSKNTQFCGKFVIPMPTLQVA